MPDDKTDPRQTNEGPASAPESLVGAKPDDSADPGAEAHNELEALVAENADMRDRLLRTMADMENLRRRTEREKTDISRYAVSNFAREILTVGDNLRRTIEHVPAEAAAEDPALKSFLEGVELTERDLLNVLERHGVTRIDPKGERFDPNNHQAMFEVHNPDLPEGTVAEVMQAGYMIGDRCLRPALVAVAKGGIKVASDDAGGNGPGRPANDDSPPDAAEET